MISSVTMLIISGTIVDDALPGDRKAFPGFDLEYDTLYPGTTNVFRGMLPWYIELFVGVTERELDGEEVFEDKFENKEESAEP